MKNRLKPADRKRLADYIDGTLGALNAGDFDHETALATVLQMTDAILDGDLKSVRDRLDEFDEYVVAEELAECRRLVEENLRTTTAISRALNSIVLSYDAEVRADDLDVYGQRAA